MEKSLKIKKRDKSEKRSAYKNKVSIGQSKTLKPVDYVVSIRDICDTID